MVYCDGVFEGGGVKGIALAGAVCVFLQRGYGFKRVAGSSAGAIVASLLAAGLDSGEIEAEMKALDYCKLKGEDWLDRFGLPGKLVSLGRSLGVYNLDYLEEWLTGVFGRRGITTFGEHKAAAKREGRNGTVLPSLRVTVTDITTGALLVLPDDLKKLGIDPAGFPIARAVRMSAGIPLFYEPVKLKAGGCTHYMVDGGLLSNYPVWIFDDGVSRLPRPVLGFRFAGDIKLQMNAAAGRLNLTEYIKQVVSVMTEAHDMTYFNDYGNAGAGGDRARTVMIPSVVNADGKCEKITATDFDLTAAQADALFENGKAAAAAFLANWDFKKWNEEYR